MPSDKQLADVYEDRNAVALAFLRSVASDYDVGYYYDENESDDWAVVFARLPVGDVSWHVPTAELPQWMQYKPSVGDEYDGYDRGEKNNRVRQYAAATDFIPAGEMR